ncbi:MAG: DUF4253 domain-containing protein [Burkholderiaceae bacterium]
MKNLRAKVSAFVGRIFGGSTDATPANIADSGLEQGEAVLARCSGRSVRPYSTRDFGREPYHGARSVIVMPILAPHILKHVRAGLGPGMIAFIGTQTSLADPAPSGTEIVVGRGSTQFDILRVAASDAVNYDMGTEDLIARLQRWDKDIGIDIYAAQTDLIQLRLKSLPNDVGAFAQEVYSFCPDIVDQGAGSLHELASEIERTKELTLWWD